MDLEFERTITPGTPPSDNELGFGQVFSDHMFTLEGGPSGWYNPRIRPYGRLPLGPAAPGYQYGQQVFEGLKAVWGVDNQARLFRAPEHLRRLKKSAAYVRLSCPPEGHLLHAISELVRIDQRWIPKSPGTSLYIRPFLLGSTCFLGIRPSTGVLAAVITSPTGPLYGPKPVSLLIEEKRSRATPGGLGSIKTGANYLQAQLATSEAQDQGFNQVLWTDSTTHQLVEEAGTMNFFADFYSAGKHTIVTPRLTDTILEGITRDAVNRVLRDHGYEVEERPLTVDELVAAHTTNKLQGAWGTGTAATIAHIGELGYRGQRFKVGDGTPCEPAELAFKVINEIQTGARSDPYGWTTLVPL